MVKGRLTVRATLSNNKLRLQHPEFVATFLGAYVVHKNVSDGSNVLKTLYQFSIQFSGQGIGGLIASSISCAGAGGDLLASPYLRSSRGSSSEIRRSSS